MVALQLDPPPFSPELSLSHLENSAGNDVLSVPLLWNTILYTGVFGAHVDQSAFSLQAFALFIVFLLFIFTFLNPFLLSFLTITSMFA